jgi:hypothetical protein
MTIKISELGNLTAVYGNVVVPVVANVAGTLITVKGNLDQLTSYIISGPTSAIASTDANVTVSNVTLKGYIDGQISAVNTSVTLANTIQSQQIVNATLANTIQSQQIVNANVGIIGYIDQGNTIQTAYINGQIAAANAGVTAANIGMKGYVDSVASQSIYGNSNVKSYLIGGFDGNIIPAADVTYNLGSSTNKWKDLWLSGSTIYIGNANITANGTTISAEISTSNLRVTSNLTVGGNVIFLSSESISINNGTIETSAPINAPSITVDDITIGAAQITANGSSITANIITPNLTVTSNLTVNGTLLRLGGATLEVLSGNLQSSIPIRAPITSTSNLIMQGARVEFAQGAYISEEAVFDSPGQYSLTLTSAEDGIVGLNAIGANTTVLSSIIVSNSSVQINVANTDPITGNINFWYYDSFGGITFPDGSRQDTAYDSNVSFTMANVSHWTSSVYTVADALNQLAERIFNIENP